VRETPCTRISSSSLACVVAAAGFLLAYNRGGEVVESARIGARAKQYQSLVGEARAHLRPVHDFALRGWLPDFLQLGNREGVAPSVLRVHHDRHRVVGDRNLDVFDAVLLAEGVFLFADRAGRACDVDFTVSELFEAAACARLTDRRLHFRMRFGELFGDRFGDRQHCAGAVDTDGA
jgi:hypothetical protein